MGLFSFTQEIAMDLGTANTIITTNGKIVVDEPSVVALDRRTDKMIAVGEKAKLMHEKTHENIRTIRPLRDGVIADFYACEQMIRGLIKMVNNRNRLFSPSLRMVIGVPSGSTEVELRAVRDSAEHAGGRDVYLIFEPMAAAIGIGIDVEAPEGNMIVDIGGGSTEIAVISLGGIVSNNSIRIAGDDLTADIQEYMSRQHNVKVSERMAERIKINVGAALTELGEDAPEDYIVHGPNRITALPMEVPVCYQEVAHCLEKSISKIETAILSALENTPPELYADIVHNGIYLAGGGALLRGLDKRLTDKINIPFHIAEDPLHAVAKGTGRCTEECRPLLIPDEIGMRNLLNFLIKYNYWFLFLLLEVTSFVLLFRFNHYQQSVYFTSANGVAGKVYEISGGISSYFHLKSVNEDLLDRNMWLEQRVAFLEKSLQEQGLDSVKLYSMARLAPDDYRIFKANVIKNSLNKADNYITLDRGSSDGIRPEMGVVDANGVVGIVYKTSPRYSLVIPLLNSKSSISCKIVGSEYFGYLKWEGGDSRFAYLKDLPRHAEFNLGDTVVTSGYSTVFPEGVMVGTVDDMSDSHDGLSYLLKIKLATDFGKVSNVRVISRSGQEEQNMLEKEGEK